MSRYTGTTTRGKRYAYGYDRTLGYFVQVYKSEEDEWTEEEQETGEGFHVNKDSRFSGLTGPTFVQLCGEWGIPIDPSHSACAFLDMSF